MPNGITTVSGLLAGLKVATSLIVWQPAEDWQPLFDKFLGFLSGTEQAAILSRLQQVICIENNYLCTYDLYSPVHIVLDVCISIMRASGRGLGPGIPEFFGPCETASSH
jgi:hypothetical protein